MSFLFDISPTETEGKKSTKKRSVLEPIQASEPALRHSPKTYTQVVQQIIGTVDHAYECADGACGAMCHDILREEQGDWYLVCALCGTGQWALAIVEKKEPPKKKPDDVFRLRDGRFPGMTLDEVAVLDDGIACIKWWAAAKSVPPDVRDAAKSWLSSHEKNSLDRTVGAR